MLELAGGGGGGGIMLICVVVDAAVWLFEDVPGTEVWGMLDDDVSMLVCAVFDSCVCVHALGTALFEAAVCAED